MKHKGYGDLRPLGFTAVEGGGCWYYYYKVPEGLIELEIAWDDGAHRFERKVVTFVTDEEHLRRLFEDETGNHTL